MPTLLTHIHQLLTVAPAGVRRLAGAAMCKIGILENAWLLTEGANITALGPMAICPTPASKTEVVNCSGRIVLPGYVDSHTHLVFAHTREGEWVARLQGKSYAEIAAAGGGILNSAARVAQASEEELLLSAITRAEQVLCTGTTTLEIKSGYGLTVEAELKLLRVANALRQHVPQTIQTTVLALHALPTEYKEKREVYVNRMCEELIPAAAEQGLAQYVDVFCEQGFFTVAEMLQVLEAGRRYGLQGRVHVNQLHQIGGLAAAVQAGARSVDHLEHLSDDEILLLTQSDTVPTVLPGCSFFMHAPYSPLRQMIDAGLAPALATDYNPGTCPSGNMGLVLSLVCTQMGALPSEAIAAATLNGAAALGLSATHGSLAPGKRADLLVTEPLASYEAIPYHFGRNVLERVMVGGAWVV